MDRDVINNTIAVKNKSEILIQIIALTVSVAIFGQETK